MDEGLGERMYVGGMKALMVHKANTDDPCAPVRSSTPPALALKLLVAHMTPSRLAFPRPPACVALAHGAYGLCSPRALAALPRQ